MNPFKSFTLLWWQVGILKMAMLLLGMVIGAAWPDLLAKWRRPMLVLFAILGGYIGYVWWLQ